jgi:PAS domain S-box-containing protein
MPLRRKLLLYMAIPALLLLIVGLVGIVSVLRLERAADDILSDNYHTIQQARSLERALRAIEETPPALDAVRIEEGRERLSDRFEAALAACEQNVTEAGEHAVVDRIRELWRDAGPRVLPLEFGRPPPPVDARRRAEILAPVFRSIDELIDINERAMFAFERQERGLARLMLGVVGAASGGAVLTLILFAMIAATRVSRPILHIARDLERALASRELDPVPESDTGDEIVHLQTALDDLLNRLSRHEEEQARRFHRLQDRFSFVMEESPEALVLLDEQLGVVAMNRAGRDLIGIGDLTLNGRRLSEIMEESDFAKTLEATVRDAAPGAQERREVTMERNGETLIVRPRILPFASGRDEPAGFLVILWDLTRERSYEVARKRFIAMLSHQLKTPVTALSMAVNLLWERKHGAGGETDDLLDVARADCQTLVQLISELVDAARDVTPGLSISPRRAEIVRLLRRALRSLLVQAREKGIAVDDRMGSGGQFALVDTVKFPWVVTNVFGNALRYVGRDGSITLDLSADDESIEVSVADDGIGIAPEDLDRLFVPFTSLDDDREDKPMGLGLSIAREIIEAHGGSIGVESEPGVGTVFRIRVPKGEVATG